MGLTKVEQAEALTLLLQEKYDAFGRLIEDSRGLSRDAKIDLLYKTLVLTGRRIKLAESDESVLEARGELAATITRGSEVIPFIRPSKEGQA